MAQPDIGSPPNDSTAGRVAFQGAPGAFSHEACVVLRPWDVAVAFETFAGAIDAVRTYFVYKTGEGHDNRLQAGGRRLEA